MSNAPFQLHVFKPSPVGGIGYDLILSNAEIAMLKLLLSPDESAFSYWEDFWKEIADYEDAPFGCKELMPLAVRKMQRAVRTDLWQSVAPSQATFLAGLPKYTWTKNRIIFQLFQDLSKQLASSGIPVMAIKGMAEMLRDPEVMFMRTSRDIDLVIQPKDLEKSVLLFQAMGWASEQIANGIPFPLSKYEGNSFTFDHPDHFISLDIHFDAVSDSKGVYMDFTQELWNAQIVLPGYGGFLSIPSPQNQFCLFLANAFVPDNWSTGLVNKYLYDLLRQLQDMDLVAKRQAQERAQQYLKMGDYAHQIIRLSDQIDPLQSATRVNSLVDISHIQRRLKQGLNVSEDHYYLYWHKHDLYREKKPILIQKYGTLLAYLWIVCDLIFQTRLVQVCYWRLVTWKDQCKERVRYYSGRIIYYQQHYSAAHLLRKIRAKLFFLCSGAHPNEVTNTKTSEAVDSSSSTTHFINAEQPSENFSADNAQYPFPPGMGRHFHITTKLFKI